MKLKKVLRHFAAKSKHTTAIILAGGSGSRMASDTTKQLMLIKGIPVVVRSIMAFESCELIDDIIVVAKKEELELYRDFINKYSLKKVIAVVCGGDTRQKSALQGFKKVADSCDYVAIHDAARCLVTPENISDVLEEAVRFGGASAAVRVKDTVKLSDTRDFIASTPKRDRVWNAQTPQIFKANLYRAATFYALKTGYEATDDNGLVEWLGARIKLVDCGYHNIKITTPEDIRIAELLLEEREND